LVASTITAVMTGADSIILSANAEIIILSAPPAESMILSAPSADATSNTQAWRIDDVLYVKMANKYYSKTIILSSFNGIDLSRSMLADCCMRRCHGEGTMAAVVGQWRPP
jgi:hypothetical protein